MSGRLRLAGLLVAGLLASSAVAQVSQFTPGSVASSGPVTLTGDVAGTGTGTVPTTITDLPLSKLATISANSLLGNNTGSPATAVALTTAQTKTLLAIANTDVSGLGTASTAATGTSGHTIPYLDGNNTFSGTNAFGAITPSSVAATGSISAGTSGDGNTIQVGNTSGYTIVQSFNGATSAAQIQNVKNAVGNGQLTINGGTTGGGGGLILSVDGSAIGTLTGTGLAVTGGLSASGAVTGSNLSGTNTGNQTITLTSDVTGSGTGSFATTIAANAVTYAKMQSVTAARLLGNPTGSGAVPSEISLAGGLGFSGTTLTAAGALTPTSVASTGAISGTTIAGSSSILSSGATAGVGYATGAGGAVTQLTSRTTTVINNKACGAITLFSAAGSATYATFTVTDSAVAATDTIVINEKSGTNLYIPLITSIGSGTFNVSFATTGGTATDSPVFNYCVVKGVAA